jgi:hypothetical protein
VGRKVMNAVARAVSDFLIHSSRTQPSREGERDCVSSVTAQ